MQNYTHRTKPTEYILQQNKEIRQQIISFAETAAENALYAEQAKSRANPRPSRAKAKYGAVNGVYAPFFFSAVELKVLHKSAVAFEELRLIPQKNAAVRK